MTPSVQDEIDEMRRLWPDFQVTGRCDHIVTWRGVLRPIRRPYEIRILYGPRFWLGRFRLLNRRPRVEIVSPDIVPCHPVTGENLPHVYAFPRNGQLSRLCLYDPAERDWFPGMPIAQTIVPWAAHWIACYEGWLATGEWTGGGRHPGGEAATDPVASVGGCDDVVLQREVNFIAALIGTWACRALLDYSAENVDDPLAVPVWRDITDIAPMPVTEPENIEHIAFGAIAPRDAA